MSDVKANETAFVVFYVAWWFVWILNRCQRIEIFPGCILFCPSFILIFICLWSYFIFCILFCPLVVQSLFRMQTLMETHFFSFLFLLGKFEFPLDFSHLNYIEIDCSLFFQNLTLIFLLFCCYLFYLRNSNLYFWVSIFLLRNYLSLKSFHPVQPSTYSQKPNSNYF